MMWKLLNKLFDYDYIHWHNSADSGVARVHIAPDGNIFYWRYKCTKVLDRIVRPNQVTWLTCEPSKYFKDQS